MASVHAANIPALLRQAARWVNWRLDERDGRRVKVPYRPGNPDAQREALLDERRRLATEVTNLTAAIAQGGDIPALVEKLKERDRKLKTLDAQLAKPQLVPQRDVLKAALELRTVEWRNILRSPEHLQQARLVLQRLMDLPIRIWNEPRPAYIPKGDTRGVDTHEWRDGKWTAKTRPGGLLVGLVQSVASPTGFEPVFWP